MLQYFENLNRINMEFNYEISTKIKEEKFNDHFARFIGHGSGYVICQLSARQIPHLNIPSLLPLVSHSST